MTAAALIHDPATHKLGRVRRVLPKSKRIVKLSDHMKVSQLALPPNPIDLSTFLPTDTGIKLNGTYGCCTISGLGAKKQLDVAANGGGFLPISDEQILDGYEKADGFVLGDPSTDNGGDEFSVLTWDRDVGFLNADGTRTKSLGFVEIDPSNLLHLQLALFYFGGIYNGIELPVTAQSQDVWSLHIAEGDSAEPGSWGGHCTLHEGIDTATRLMKLRTWGKIKLCTFDWWFAYGAASSGGAAYAILSPDWAQPGKVAPSGVDLTGLLADLQDVAS